MTTQYLYNVLESLGRLIDPLGGIGLIYKNDAFIVWPMVTFVVTGLVFYAVSGWRSRSLSVRAALQSVFPTQFYKHKTTKLDVINTFLSGTFFSRSLGLIATFFAGMNIRGWLMSEFGAPQFILIPGWTTVVVQVATIILVTDFFGFLGHYASHKIDFLWKFHAVHHSAEVLTPFTSGRNHPIDALWAAITTLLPGALATGTVLYYSGSSLEPQAVAIISIWNAIEQARGVLFHSHLPVSFGKLNYLFNSPVMHQIHHSAELRHRDKNMGGIVSIWDWVFGSLYIPTKNENFQLGLSEAERGEKNPHRNVGSFYLRPVIDAYGVLRGARSSAKPKS